MSRDQNAESSVPVRSIGRQDIANVWDPIARVRGDFDRPHRDLWQRPLGVGLARRIQALAGPTLELKDKADEYELIAEVPGIDPDQIDLNVADGMLRLSGERTEPHDAHSENYIFSERRYGQFERMIALPKGIDHAKISASAHNGVLSIHLPKRADAQQLERKIEITASWHPPL